MKERTWHDIVTAFEKFGGQQYTISEPITQLQHALQTYVQMCHMTNSIALRVAALLHDIGHLISMDPVDPLEGIDDRHESCGAQWLSKRGFPNAVTMPIVQHVNAKRYLCFVDPSYISKLSQGSTLSLGLQGGPMETGEAYTFKCSDYFEETMLLRACDDTGKTVGVTDLPTLASLKHIVLSVL